MEDWQGFRHPAAAMAKLHARSTKPHEGYHFRSWRKHRGLTQAQLAELVDMTESSISQLESGKQGFSNGTLKSLSDALMCTPGDLLDRDPLAAKDTPWLVFEGLSPESKAKVIDYIKMVNALEASSSEAA